MASESKQIEENGGPSSTPSNSIEQVPKHELVDSEATEAAKTLSSTFQDHNYNNAIKKPRKKRRTFSCETCRKFKTRCDFDVATGKCHRCNVLQLSCSLTRERQDQIGSIKDKILLKAEPALFTSKILKESTSLSTISSFNSNNDNSLSLTSLDRRLDSLESKLANLDSKIDQILNLNSQNLSQNQVNSYPQGTIPLSSSSITPTYNYRTGFQSQNSPTLTNSQKLNGIKLKEPPLKLIKDINERLFPTTASSKDDLIALQQRPFVVARINFLNFYQKNKDICQKLVKDFLERSSSWILPDNISTIDDEYAKNHLFITSVFTIISMTFSDDDRYNQLQEELYPLVERLLTNTLTMFEKLIDFDVEAILYCAMFHISKKAKRHRQLQFNSLVLSGFAIQSLLIVVDFYKLKERILVNQEYNAKDLYHLRILNSLTACNLEYSISYGNVSPQDVMLKELNSLTMRFPQSTHADKIKISEIDLGDIVRSIFLNFKTYFKHFKLKFQRIIKERENSDNLLNISSFKDELLIFPELEYWLKHWQELLMEEGSEVLLFTYDFYIVLICRSFISEFLPDLQKTPKFLKSTLHTMKEHSFSLLNGFLKFPPHLVKGAPTFLSHQLVYVCLTLCDFLHWFDLTERQTVLNICTKVYWHLNAIGEKKNEATDDVGTIIKSIIDTSKRRVSLVNFPAPLHEETQGSRIPPQRRSRRGTDTSDGLPTLSNSMDSNSASSGHPVLPDVDQFNSFEDFFQDFFDHLKPTSQKIFSNKPKRTTKDPQK